jgi:hypothetical protein
MPPSRTLTRSGDQEPEVGLDEARPFLPNPGQIRYAKAYLDPANPGNIKAIAAAAGVHRRSVYTWMQDPEFCLWLKEQAERVITHHLPIMWQRCLELAIQGSPEHIKLIALRSGELRQDAPNGRGPGVQVFLNVPRPRYELPQAPTDTVLDVTPRRNNAP